MKRIKHTVVVAMVVATALAVRAAPQDEGALSRVKENFIRVLCASDARLSAEIAAAGDMHDIGDFTVRAVRDVLPPDGDRIEALLRNQREDGSWADVDYDSATRSVWPAAVHLENMKALARAPRTERTIEAFHRALGFWLGRNFRNPNWWWNEIGAPLSLGSSALMMDGELSAEERTGVVSAMRECKIGMTGQNRVWLAECVLMRALLEGCEHDLAAARNAISDEIAISRTEEGIQEEWSFHQHGNMAQFGNYGASYILTVSRLAAVFAGTGSDLPEEKMAILENLVDKGFRPVVWRGAMDVGSLGRQLSPNAMRKKGLSPLVAAWWLSKTGREEAKRIFRDCLADMHGERAEVQRTGLCWFPKSATGTYRADGWMAAVKCETASIKGTERINEDNILGAHLADGALFTSVTGDEYRDVFPLWNWRHVPGTTSYDIKDVDWEDRNLADKCEVRGCEVEFVLDRAGLKARTRWRFSDAGVDVDVSGIASTNAHPVVTTVEQSIARPNASWCYEDGGIVAVNGFIRYELPSNAVVRIEERTGSWRDNMGALPCEPVKGRVFEIVIPHGIRPDGVGCSWRVRPLAANMRSPFKDGDRVVFFGDSITHGGYYGEYVNLFYATRYPERNIWFSNSGWSGASAEQGLWSIEDDVVAKRPTVVTVMFGMNDINRDAWPRTNDTPALAAARDGAIRIYDSRMDELVRRVRAEAGNPEIIYFTPSPYDQTCLVDGKPSDIVCNDGLAILADHVRSWAARDKATCVDLQKTMLAINAEMQKEDPSASIVRASPTWFDRVHPGPLGHTVMLYEILKAQDAESYVDEIERDANGADALVFTCTEKSLPFPMTDEMRRALGLVPFEKDFNREILRVRNLKDGRYAVKIDGAEVGVWTAAELSEGVNLALNEKTPQYRQATEAAEICRRFWSGERMLRDLVTRRRWMRMHYKIDPDAPGAVEGLLDKLLANGMSEDSYEVRTYRAYLKNWPRHAEFEAAVVKARAALAEAVRPKEHRFEIAFARPAPRPALAARIAEGPEIYGIVHWGLNTYTDREWGFGDEDPAMLNPGQFDADQIVGACKAGGLGGLIVVAKHHDGFCLWPTKTTEHNITKSPFGKDYVKEMEQACRRAGVKFGVYVSPWDRNNAAYGTEKYVADVFQKQIRELLSGDYGEIFEMWFDGANGGDGWYGGAREKRRIGTGYYRFDEVFGFVRELQPKVCIFAGEEDASDFRWPGNERGVLDPDSRATICMVGGYAGGKYGNPDYKDQINSGSPNGKSFRVCEADFPLRRGWFYHDKERGTTKSSAYLAKLYVGTVGNGGTMNIGVAPNKDGRLDADDLKALAGFKVMKDALFAHEANDGEKFNVVVMREDVTNGELVDEWEFVADGNTILHGKSIGIKRIRLLREPVFAKNCSVRVVRGVGAPKVSYTLYRADQAVIDAILDAKGCEDETDTAKWMTGKASAPREYFVSPAGDDAADGSAAHPWRTIGRAASVAQAGDTITVREGIYREWVKPANAGRDGAPITYRAAKGERVVVTGADEVRGWTKRPDGLWETHVSYDSFGGVNPFTDFIAGAWFIDNGAKHFRTRLIQEGKPLNLVGEEILAPPDHGVPALEIGTAALIPGRVSGMIVAAFEHDPNVEVPELVVRPCCFYPTTTRRDYIALRGIAFRDAAPTWAHPRGEQPGVVGTNWSRGWTIEDCEISGSCCAGLTLGKCANDFDSFWNDPKQSFSLCGKRLSERDLSEIGHHTVRRCRISDCGQAGICVGFSAVWSSIEDCDISDCFRDKKSFSYEMAGIKIHAAVGMTIRRNRIHDNGSFGVWLDWMAQGTRLSGNVFWNNDQHDLYLEVVHGPNLLEGNDFLSEKAIHFKGSNNIALVGNRIFGSLACDDDASLGYRKTPVFHPHSTRIKELYADCVPTNLVFINNILSEVPRFPDLAADPCRYEDNFLVPREYWGINAPTGDVGIAPPPSLPRPDFKPVTAERLGTGLFTGEEFPLPDAQLAIPEWGMRI